MRYSVRSLARPLLENADKKLIKSKGEVNRLKILVCVKQVPDTTEIKIDPVTNTLIRNGVPSIVNPFDKNALEAALQLKDKYGDRLTGYYRWYYSWRYMDYTYFGRIPDCRFLASSTMKRRAHEVFPVPGGPTSRK